MILIPYCIAALVCLTSSRAAASTKDGVDPLAKLQSPLERFYDGTFQDPLPSANELTNQEKQNAVKEAFLFAWEGYRTYSWGFDENRPVSNTPLTSR